MCVTSISTIRRFSDVFNAFLFGFSLLRLERLGRGREGVGGKQEGEEVEIAVKKKVQTDGLGLIVQHKKKIFCAKLQTYADTGLISHFKHSGKTAILRGTCNVPYVPFLDAKQLSYSPWVSFSVTRSSSALFN